MNWQSWSSLLDHHCGLTVLYFGSLSLVAIVVILSFFYMYKVKYLLLGLEISEVTAGTINGESFECKDLVSASSFAAPASGGLLEKNVF